MFQWSYISLLALGLVAGDVATRHFESGRAGAPFEEGACVGGVNFFPSRTCEVADEKDRIEIVPSDFAGVRADVIEIVEILGKPGRCGFSITIRSLKNSSKKKVRAVQFSWRVVSVNGDFETVNSVGPSTGFVQLEKPIEAGQAGKMNYTFGIPRMLLRFDRDAEVEMVKVAVSGALFSDENGINTAPRGFPATAWLPILTCIPSYASAKALD